ncbi:guanine nucleotide-binding protein subunit gamma-e isoform X2 [Osmia lignaria lignaria]|uniref:guanine nucleotide-binding protein subunit gamma-e isoform X2 n=1 Tax=Osmia lignaria lignaria TaxID=1437193 RepID=UPI001479632F|nr:guanine nucleotide-binding protein subunit gamma-e isoform X2 [Osmia lignaria]
MDPSVLANMDKDALKKQIENMKYQASMERWPLSKSIAALFFFEILSYSIHCSRGMLGWWSMKSFALQV